MTSDLSARWLSQSGRALAIACALIGLSASPAWAQEEFLNLFSPELGKLPIRSDYRITWFPDQPVAGQSAELGLLQQDFTLSAPLRQSPSDEWSASVRLRNQEFATGAVLPDTGEPFPDELWNIRFGLGYRHRFESNWIAALQVAVGSPSDEPFASLDEMDISATAVLRVPARDRDAWIFFLNYASNREFLPHIPIPGFGYSYEPSDQFSAIVTTGIVSLQYRPVETLTFSASYIAVRTVDVRLTYQVFRPVRVWVGFDWTNERYLLANRADPDDRLFYYEKRIRAGAIIGLARQLFVDLTVGYSFDRFYFEGESYSDRDQNRVDVGDGPFAAIRVGTRF
ncbi:MAG TPA: hypothetical protein VHO73_11485 [Methylomirabilota bacterium]|nr:hypothetical protein [Methylomirabilota bacterium]